MTNMPEAKLAREAELCYATLALVTDYDVWHESHETVTVEAVIQNLLRNVATAKDVLRRVIPAIAGPRACAAPSLLAQRRDHRSRRAFPLATRRRLDLLLGKYFPRSQNRQKAPWLTCSWSVRWRSTASRRRSARSRRCWAAPPPSSRTRRASSRRSIWWRRSARISPRSTSSCSRDRGVDVQRAPGRRPAARSGGPGAVRLRPERGQDPRHPAQRLRRLPPAARRRAGPRALSLPGQHRPRAAARRAAPDGDAAAAGGPRHDELLDPGQARGAPARPARGRRRHRQRRRGPPARRASRTSITRRAGHRGAGPARWSWSSAGEYGALLMLANDAFFVVPAYPLESVFDPTGAGDTFAGGFMGYLAARDRTDAAAMRRAIVYGSVMASFTVEDFSLNRLARLDARGDRRALRRVRGSHRAWSAHERASNPGQVRSLVDLLREHGQRRRRLLGRRRLHAARAGGQGRARRPRGARDGGFRDVSGARAARRRGGSASCSGCATWSCAPRSWPTPSTRATAPTAASSARTSCSRRLRAHRRARGMPARWSTAPPWTISAITGRA